MLPGGARFISGSVDKTAKLFTFGGELERTFEVGSGVLCVAALPDGVHFVVGLGDGEVRLYHVDGTLVHTFKGHTESVHAVAVTPDGQHIISGSVDKLVKVWSVASKSLVSTCAGHTDGVTAVAAMPDGQRILSGGGGGRYHCDKTVRVWLLNGTHQNTFELHTSHVLALVALPDNQHALSGSYDKTVKLFNVNDGAVLRTFTHHAAPAWRCCPTASASSAVEERGGTQTAMHRRTALRSAPMYSPKRRKCAEAPAAKRAPCGGGGSGGERRGRVAGRRTHLNSARTSASTPPSRIARMLASAAPPSPQSDEVPGAKRRRSIAAPKSRSRALRAPSATTASRTQRLRRVEHPGARARGLEAAQVGERRRRWRAILPRVRAPAVDDAGDDVVGFEVGAEHAGARRIESSARSARSACQKRLRRGEVGRSRRRRRGGEGRRRGMAVCGGAPQHLVEVSPRLR